jgi:GTP-binding protein
MPIPRVAIIGRPNVGKSSLLNMIAGEKVSIVDPTPGTTRDRVSAIAELKSPDGRGPIKPVEIIDTGGWGVYEGEGERFNEIGVDLAALRKHIENQIGLAVESADLILFCIDAQAGITPADKEVARLLRERKLGGGGKRPKGTPKAPKKKTSKSGKKGVSSPSLPIRIVATKVDGPKWESHGLEVSALGLGEPILISAKSNYFRRDFLDALYEALPEVNQAEPESAAADMKLAIIGKAGEERVIVSEIAGTTRDAVDVRLELDGKSLLAIDTAGLRRKKSFANQIEWWAFDRAKRAIDRADVVLLLVDATDALSQVDQQLAMLVQKAFKPCLIVVNKWDLVEGKKNDKGQKITPSSYEEYLRQELKGLSFAPIAFVSATTGKNIRPAIALAFELMDQSRMRAGTGKLNRLMEKILETANPPSKLGTRAKVLYVAQVAESPPTIVLVVNRPELFTANYQRFLMNRFREELPYNEVPIRLLVRGRKRTKAGIDPRDETLSESEGLQLGKEALAEMSEQADDYFDDES